MQVFVFRLYPVVLLLIHVQYVVPWRQQMLVRLEVSRKDHFVLFDQNLLYQNGHLLFLPLHFSYSEHAELTNAAFLLLIRRKPWLQLHLSDVAVVCSVVCSHQCLDGNTLTLLRLKWITCELSNRKYTCMHARTTRKCFLTFTYGCRYCTLAMLVSSSKIQTSF